MQKQKMVKCPKCGGKAVKAHAIPNPKTGKQYRHYVHASSTYLGIKSIDNYCIVEEKITHAR